MLHKLALLVLALIASTANAQLGDKTKTDTHVAITPALDADFDLIHATAKLSPAWSGPLIGCPTCKGKGKFRQDCRLCGGAGDVGCARCLGSAAGQSYRAFAVTETTALYGTRFPWKSWTEAIDVDFDRKGFWFGPGSLPCIDEVHRSNSKEKCKACRGKLKLECPDCAGHGRFECFPCNGKGQLERSCGDCGGAGQIPDPLGRSQAELASCLWCNNSGMRACADGWIQPGDEAARFLDAKENCNYVKSSVGASNRVGLPGISVGPCPVCRATGMAECYRCAGKGKSLCFECFGKGQVNAAGGSKRCSNCNGKGMVECLTCSGNKRIPCLGCVGNNETILLCLTCNGYRFRECTGCFRFDVHQWQVNADRLEAEGDLDSAVFCYELILTRLSDRETNRLLYLEKVGIDWMTTKRLSPKDLAKDERKAHNDAQTKLQKLVKRLTPDQ